MKILLSVLAFASVGVASAQVLQSSAGVSYPTLGVVDFHLSNVLSHKKATLSHLDGEAWAQADYGYLHSAANAASDGGTAYSWAQGYSKFTDTLTITGGVGTGNFFVDMMATGTHAAAGTGFSHGYLTWSNAISGIPGVLPIGTGTYAGLTPIHFTYGVPFSFYADLVGLALFTNGGVGTASVDYTVGVAATHIYDGLGHPLSGMTISSASGYSYPAAVPEPATFAALGLGLVAVVRRRARR